MFQKGVSDVQKWRSLTNISGGKLFTLTVTTGLSVSLNDMTWHPQPNGAILVYNQVSIDMIFYKEQVHPGVSQMRIFIVGTQRISYLLPLQRCYFSFCYPIMDDFSLGTIRFCKRKEISHLPVKLCKLNPWLYLL